MILYTSNTIVGTYCGYKYDIVAMLSVELKYRKGEQSLADP